MDIAKIRKKMKETKPALPSLPEEEGLKTKSLEQRGCAEGASSFGYPHSLKNQPVPDIQDLHLTGQKIEELNISKEITLSPEAMQMDLLVFKLAGEEYSFLLEDVKEILKKQYITSVPLAPHWVLGITSLRGTVIPVIDLTRKLLGIPSKRDRKSRILIMEGKEGTIGCMVDEVEGVKRCGRNQKKEIPHNMTDKERAFIEAIFVVDDRFITLLKKEIIESKI